MKTTNTHQTCASCLRSRSIQTIVKSCFLTVFVLVWKQCEKSLKVFVAQHTNVYGLLFRLCFLLLLQVCAKFDPVHTCSTGVFFAMIIYLRRFGMSPAELTSFNDMSVDTTDGRGGGGRSPPNSVVEMCHVDLKNKIKQKLEYKNFKLKTRSYAI